MQLLSVAIPHHDANLAYFDGGRVRYLKVERTRQHKRFHFTELADWAAEARDRWGLDPQALDGCVFSLDPAALPPHVRQHVPREASLRLGSGETLFEPLPPQACDYLGVRHAHLLGHHYAHALSSWMLEPPRGADVAIVVDGVGDGRSWSVYRGDRLVAWGDVRRGSIGWGMREAGKRLGIQAAHYNDIAGKLMALQSFGRIDAAFRARLRALTFGRLASVWSWNTWVDHAGGEPQAQERKLDWAASVHAATGDLLLDFFHRFAQPGETIAYSGGVAQNVLWNAGLKAQFPGLVVPPHASDEGLALGGLEWLRRQHALPPLDWPAFPYAQADEAVPGPSAATLEAAAQLLAQGRAVGWYQGHGEVGPRALGHRSILLDARVADGRDVLNRIKRREPYRPFGASVLAEHFGRHFEGPADAFMLYACRVRDGAFPAVTHVDGTCRVQLVDDRSPLRPLLERFHALTGCAVLANTSLNVAGRPLAAAPAHARELFAQSPLDALAIGDELLTR
jgi:carbamoyltransferase